MDARSKSAVARFEVKVHISTGVVITLLLAPVLSAGQWLKYTTPGIPRTGDGKVDLSAPVPRTPDGKPDLSGLWQPDSGGYLINITADLMPAELLPWAAALTKQ